MSSDTALIIPHLSKELNLIGHPSLPYSLEKSLKKKYKNDKSGEEYKIVFDSKLMLDSLTNVCFELVKQIKVIGVDENNALDKLNFENSKLQKQLKSSKSEIEKHITELASLKAANQRLQEKVDNLEKKIKDQKVLQETILKKNQTSEDILKHVIKKNETNLFNLHKAVWKQFNLADQNYFPENFKLVQLNQPDFSKLWSTVKHSEPRMREDALKKAVCIFQENNNALMEENFSLKTVLLTTLNEIRSTIRDFNEKLHLPESVLSEIKFSDIITNIEEFDTCKYGQTVSKYVTVVKQVCQLFDKASFIVDEDLFVCWSQIIDNLCGWAVNKKDTSNQ